ncbi:MAG: carboxypeptidase-like regulatory domain-containing protein [Flavobacterium sp.]|uniref:carboxypeptidase-like regulatory domain-containing protein n=1 Tax=Flavobacterium sp. TaxID=239 RepID=UPI003BA689AB
MNFKYIFFFLLICNVMLAQEKSISGSVIDIENNSVIQYVNIGIINKSIGTVSNSKGVFTLKLNDISNLKDSLVFSHIGYKTKKMLVSSLIGKNNSIELEPLSNDLNEVIVTFKQPKSKRFGRSAKGLSLMHFNFYSYYEKDVDDRLSKEIGIKFKLKKDCKIENLNFNITQNDFKSLKFRLNFYKIENGLPTELLNEKDIIFEVKENFTGWYSFDIKPFDVFLYKENEEVAATIQWIESVKKDEKSKYFAISTALSATETAFYREKAMDVWTKTRQGLSFYLNAMCK